jgi:hypothetical protein
MKILINYAHLTYYASRYRNTKSGLELGGFDKCIEWHRSDLGELDQYRVMTEHKGAGYWLWKPWIILQTLKNMDEDDLLFYCDAGCSFLRNAQQYLDLCTNSNSVVLFEGGHANYKYTKGDCFALMGCDESYYNRLQLTASFQIARKTDFAISFYEEFFEYAKDERILTDIPNQVMDNLSGFIDHRHDQSILTNLAIKHNIKLYQDPSQWGDHVREPGFEKLIHHHRERV